MKQPVLTGRSKKTKFKHTLVAYNPIASNIVISTSWRGDINALASTHYTNSMLNCYNNIVGHRAAIAASGTARLWNANANARYEFVGRSSVAQCDLHSIYFSSASIQIMSETSIIEL